MDVNNLKVSVFNPSVFHAYDVRGLWPEELDFNTVELISRGFIEYLRNHDKGNFCLVARDVRASSEEISELISSEFRSLGVDILDAGIVTTPMFNFILNESEVDGGIMVTASHNSIRYGGLKLYDGGEVLSENSGLKEIKRLIAAGFDNAALRKKSKGKIEKKDFSKAYADFLRSKISLPSPIAAVFDSGGGAVGVILPEILSGLNIVAHCLSLRADPSLMEREPNPMLSSALRRAQDAILETNAKAGFVFDPDGDRVAILDENGFYVRSDAVLWLLAKYLAKHGDTVITDLRSSEFLKENLENESVRVTTSRVGHSFIKEAMRENNAVLAGELSGHFYFKDFFNSESGILAALRVLEIISTSEKTLSELVKPYFKYFHSGEINFLASGKEKIISDALGAFKGGQASYTDGLTVRYPDWWFNLRASNTEDILRLVIEAKSKTLFDEKKDEVMKFLFSKGCKLI